MNFNFIFYISLEKKYYNITTPKHRENQQLKCNIKMNYEDLLQQKIVIWYKNEYQRHGKGLIMAVPNGGSRNIIEAKKLKATGTMAGVSDLIILHNGKTLFCELKIEKGIQSEKQKEFESIVTNLGFEYKIIRNLEDFKTWIQSQ